TTLGRLAAAPAHATPRQARAGSGTAWRGTRPATGRVVAEAARTPPRIPPGRGLGATHRRPAAGLSHATPPPAGATIKGHLQESAMATHPDDLAAQLRGAPASQLAQQLGISQEQSSAAISAALPLIMGALGKNASQPQGAQSLLGALQKDHAGGDIGSVLGAVMGGGGQGGAILGHIFGGNQARAETGVAQA